MAPTQNHANPETADHLLSFLTPAQRKQVASRRRHCEPCSQNEKLTIITVHCQSCGCGGVSLIHGRCKLRKWPTPPKDADGNRLQMPSPPKPDPEPPAWERGSVYPHHAHITRFNECQPGAIIRDIFIYGFPGEYAGANTELHHQLILWRRMGLTVHLIPQDCGCKRARLYPELVDRGVIVHEPDDFEAIIPGAPVLAFCNTKFLDKLDRILKHTHNTVFVNCMTWLFKGEKVRHHQGKLAAFIYQNDEVRQQNATELSEINPDEQVQHLHVWPYFDNASFPFVAADNRPRDAFVIGHISRQDEDKFAADTLAVWEAIDSPLPKRGLMLGFGSESEQKIGTPPDWVETFKNHEELSQQAFYRQADVIVQPMDTTENWPRVGLEAMSSGSVLIVDNRGGWQQMIEHGVTGWLCDTPDDFVKYATRMAHEPEERATIAEAARRRLDELAGYEVAAAGWSAAFERLGVALPDRGAGQPDD